MGISVKQLISIAKEKGVVIATAESCTGGLLAAKITSVPGSSAVFDRGFIIYSNQSKEEMLKVNRETLIKFGAVSTEVAIEMAIGALNHSKANLTLSITGVAGPGHTAGKPEGLVCFGWAGTNIEAGSELIQFGQIGRYNVRKKSVSYGLEKLFNILN